MPALSFKKQFCPLVEAGEKTHSLRSKRQRKWKAGDNLSLYYAMRTKQCRQLGRTVVTALQEVEIHLRPVEEGMPFAFDIWIDGDLLSADEAESFAKRDGFQDLAAMRLFWVTENGLERNDIWRGDLIHWKFPFVAGASTSVLEAELKDMANLARLNDEEARSHHLNRKGVSICLIP